MTNEAPSYGVERYDNKSIGSIIGEINKLSAAQIEQVLNYQTQNGVKFGEAAVSLGLIKSADVMWALSKQFEYPNLSRANIGVSAELVSALAPFSAQAELFRDVRSNLIASMDALPIKRPIAVVSEGSGDGRTYVAANLAVAFSQLGARTLLVDADMRRPRQHKLFNFEAQVGLSNVLMGRSEPNVVRPIGDIENLYVLPVGVIPPNPLELVQRSIFGQMMAQLSSKFDYIVVDTPAFSRGSDAKVIASQCGSAFLVAKTGASTMEELTKIVKVLNKPPLSFLGILMNRQ